MRVDATDRKPPLFLLITAPAKDMVEAAVKRVRDIMDNAYVRNSGGFPGIKIPVEMELDPTFNIKAKIIGDKVCANASLAWQTSTFNATFRE